MSSQTKGRAELIALEIDLDVCIFQKLYEITLLSMVWGFFVVAVVCYYFFHNCHLLALLISAFFSGAIKV